MSTNRPANGRAGDGETGRGNGKRPNPNQADSEWDDPRDQLGEGGFSKLKTGRGGASETVSRSNSTPYVRRSTGSGSRADSKEGLGSMVWGGVLLAIGLAVTIGSYASASSSSGGGRYVITYGLIIVGGIRMVTGFFTWIANR